MAPTGRRRLLAVMVAALTIWIQAGLPAAADGLALFRGRVLGADGSTPRPGFTIALVDEADGSVFRSTSTDERGVFRLDSASPGSYVVVAEGPEGAFAVPGHVELLEGENPAVAIALQPAEGQDPEGEDKDKKEDPAPTQGEAEGEGDAGAQQPPSTPPPPPVQKEGTSPVVKGIIAGIVGAAAIYAVLEITDDEETGSPF